MENGKENPARVQTQMYVALQIASALWFYRNHFYLFAKNYRIF